MSFEELQRRIQEALRTDLVEARRLVTAFRRRAERSGEPLRRAEARFQRAQLDDVAGRLGRAAAGYTEARDLFRRHRDRRRVLAAELGAVQVHALLGEKDAVRAGAVRLRRLAREPLHAASVEIALGNSFDSLGDARRAETSFRRALEILRGRRTPAAAAQLRAAARVNLANCLAHRGAVAAALEEFDRALAFYLESGLSIPAEVTRYNRGWARGVAGRAADALSDLREAQAAFRARGDKHFLARALVDEAYVLLRLGDLVRAGELAREAARSLRRVPAPIEAARAELLLARAEFAAGRTGAASKVAQRARAACRKAGDAAGEALAALLAPSSAADAARAETTLRGSGHWIGALDALVARARAAGGRRGAQLLERRARTYPTVLRRWVRPDVFFLRAAGATGSQRLSLLRRAFRAAESLRGAAPGSRLRASALAAHLEIYETLARALLDRGRPRDRKEAFLVLDAARARTLREEMAREAPGLDEQPSVRAARERLEALWRVLERHEGRHRTVELQLLQEVARRERELVSALDEADRTEAGRAVARDLPADACLAFAVVGNETIGMLARAGGVAAWSCGRTAKLREELDAFRFQVNRRLFGATDARTAHASLESLGRRLLRRAPDLSGLADLRVVLPAELGSLPVEALPGGDGRALLETARITYSPCACTSPSSWRKRGGALVVGIGTNQLTEVAREVASVGRALPGARVLKGARATHRSILDALSGQRVVHLAGHARAREDLSLLSALAVRDGWIAAADLRGRALRRALVVLSACRTGDPSLRWHGEAMGGFPRVLLAAGAAGIVASRWEVPDETAHAWMREFYRALKTGPPEEALAAAARRVRERRPHPADWACFLLIRGSVV